MPLILAPIRPAIKNARPGLSARSLARYSGRMGIQAHITGLGAALLASLMPALASAQTIISTGQSFMEADLVAGAPVAEGGRIAGLNLSMADGWKTYWRSPGETGVPPVFDWSGSRNLRSVEVLWPMPELFESFGMQTVGYSHVVVLPLVLEPEDASQPIELNLKATLGVCRELCVVEEFSLARSFAPDEVEAENRVTRSVGAVPGGAADTGLAEASCRIRGAGSSRDFEARLRFARDFTAPVVLVEGPESVWIGTAETEVEGEELAVRAKVEMFDESAWIDRSDLRLTVLDGPFAADIQGCATPPG